MTDIDINEVIEFGKSMGDIRTLTHIGAYSDLLKYSKIFKIRENEEYKKIGLTWELCCTDVFMEPKRTVNDKLKDIKPLVDNFQASLAQISTIPFNKIRYLGKSIGKNGRAPLEIENNNIIIDNIPIPITSDNKEEIEAAIDNLIETHKAEKETLQKKLEKQKAKLEANVAEATKELKAELDDTKAAKEMYKQEADRLKPFDITEVDIPEVKEFIKQIHDISIKFELTIRKFTNFINDERLNKELKEKLEEDMSSQAEIEKYLFRTYRNIKDLRMDWDNEFYPDDDGGPDFDPFSETNKK